jgi:hypothetical protein
MGQQRRQKNIATQKEELQEGSKVRKGQGPETIQLARSTCRLAYNYITNIVSPDSTSNPKFWEFVKSLHMDNTGVSPLKDSSGITHADSTRKAEILNSQFSSVFNKDDTTHIPDKGPSSHSEMPSINVGTNGVYKILTQLNIYKATGPDEISCPI